MALLEKTIAADHPAAQGHFPGNPIIPGAVLLSETLRMIEAALGVRLAPYRVRRAKFPHPARPGDRLVVEFARPEGGALRFACAVNGARVLEGEIECRDTSAT